MIRKFYDVANCFTIFIRGLILCFNIRVYIAKESKLYMYIKVLHINPTGPITTFHQAPENLLFSQLPGKGDSKEEVSSHSHKDGEGGLGHLGREHLLGPQLYLMI